MEFTDRYDGHYPRMISVCNGHCEGMGFVPVKLDSQEDGKLIDLWREAEEKCPTEDGWHFVICPECNGTGRKSLAKTIFGLPRYIYKHVLSPRFIWDMVIMGGTHDMWRSHSLENKPISKRIVAVRAWISAM